MPRSISKKNKRSVREEATNLEEEAEADEAEEEEEEEEGVEEKNGTVEADVDREESNIESIECVFVAKIYFETREMSV